MSTPLSRRLVLVVEDEPPIAELIELYLERAGFRTLWAADGARALSMIEDPAVELVLLDLMLPDADGVDVFRAVRARRDLPVIMVTARDAESDRVLGLELGADDYVTKPFSPRELVARVRAVLRREERAASAGGPVLIGRLRVDPAARVASVEGSAIELTRKEFDLLWELVSNAGRVLSRAALLRSVWGYPDDADTRTVDVHVAQLRRKLAADSPVVTVRGIGYRATTG